MSSEPRDHDAEVAEAMEAAVDLIEDLLDGRKVLKGEVGRAADQMILEGSSFGRMSRAQLNAAGRVGLNRHARRALAAGGKHG